MDLVKDGVGSCVDAGGLDAVERKEYDGSAKLPETLLISLDSRSTLK